MVSEHWLYRSIPLILPINETLHICAVEYSILESIDVNLHIRPLDLDLAVESVEI